MATIDEIFENMPAEASVTYEELIIDAEARQIIVPDAEALFGVESDTHSERKHFRCPRYVGNGLDLAACFLRVNFRNANGDVDSYLIEDATIDGEDITFSWELSKKVTAYKGAVMFNVCAIMGAGLPEWNTTLAEGTVLEGLEPDSSTVEAETADVVAQLLATVAAQTAAVEGAGADWLRTVQITGVDQVAAVQTAGKEATQEAKAAVEAKGDAVRATIPEDYSTLSATVDKLTRDRAAAIVCEAEGETIQVTDSSADPLVGLRIFGKSTQNGTPTPDAPVEIVSAKAPVVTVCGKNLCPENAFVTMGSSGKETNTYDATSHTITMDAAPTTSAGRYCAPYHHFVVGQSYALSFDLRGTAGKKVRCGWDSNHLRITLTAEYARYSVVVVATRANEPIIFYSAPVAEGGLAAGEFMQFDNVQIEMGTVATEYEPYKEAQTLTLSTPDSLPGIPVTSGGNYTDVNGQQWIADEIDLARGVYVQRIVCHTITSACRIVEWNGEGGVIGITITGLPYDNTPKDEPVGVCSHFKVRLNGTLIGDAIGVRMLGDSHRFYILNTAEVTTLDEWKAFFDEQASRGTPVRIMLPAAEPIETPLSTEEIEAFKALLANKPTTTVLNDAGAWMALEYAADPKTYIDNKIAALFAAKN